MANITSIADRLTPSAPIELTFGAQPASVGRKITTIFAHKLAGAQIADYDIHDVINVGDHDAVRAEVDLLFGVDSEASKMAYAFVAANSLKGRSNFPAFRIVAIPSGVVGFGPAGEALISVKMLRSDMLISCYAAGAPENETLFTFAEFLSGPDRDLTGQFGSFVTVGSLDAVANTNYVFNSRFVIVAHLQDTNTALISNVAVDTIAGSNIIDSIISTAGINVGAKVTGTGIPANTTVVKVYATSIQLSDVASITSVAELLDFQNVISQDAKIVAAAHAAGLMSFIAPYNPVNGVEIGGLIPPRKKSDIVLFDPFGASEALLNNGISPLTVKPGNVVAFIRTRTTKTLNGVITVKDYFDYQQLVIMNDFREVCFQVSQNPPFNNNPGGTKASAQVAALFKDEVLKQALSFQELGMFQGVKTLSKLFIVQPGVSDRARFDFKIPVNVLPNLNTIAGNIQGVSDIGNFSL